MKTGSQIGFLLSLALIILATPLSTMAGQINWRGLANRDHLSSTGQPLNGNVVFELGAFSEDFTPTADNTAAWAEHWSPIDRTVYQESRKLFASSTVISSNAPPFTIGHHAYIWGYQTDSEASEWILLRKAGWTWPSPNLSALPLSWIVSLTGTDVILGSINEETYLKTAAIAAEHPLPSISPESWRSQRFSEEELSDPSISAWEADPDGDTLPNMLEYAYATDPLVASKALPTFLKLTLSDNSNHSTLTLTRSSERLVSLTIEHSLDRVHWSPIDQRASSRVSDGLRFDRFTISIDGLSHEFYRSRVAWLSE